MSLETIEFPSANTSTYKDVFSYTPLPGSVIYKVNMDILSNITNYKMSMNVASSIFYIYNLLDNNYYVVKPFKVELLSINSEIIGDIENLELYAYGESVNEVLNELKEDILDLYNDLSNTNDENLGSYPRRWKQILTEQIKKKTK